MTDELAVARDALLATLRGAGCVFAEDETDLLLDAAADSAELSAMTERRVAGEPLEQIVGWAEFCGIRVGLESGVFVPRRRTELVVREAIDLLERGDVVIDLCCGSGAVGLILASRVGPIELHAVDIEAAAVRCARRNLFAVGTVYEGDLDAPLPTAMRGRVDVITANAPYVPTEAIQLMPAEARLHEPTVALDGGADGVAIHRRIAAVAAKWLRPGGSLVIETSSTQHSLTEAAMAQHHLVVRTVTDDELSATVTIGKLAL